jgi:hypothetical protein
MNVQLDTRNVFLSGLIALVVLASAFLALASKASAVLNDCPAGKVCLWAGQTFGGQQSFWNAWETGCHALANIDPQSIRNNTNNRTVTYPANVGPGLEYQFFSPWTGSFCFS